ncbi:hypothetical protein [Actinokineospora iranica]|uniref:Uncharacterized protein n=1 Tax=Actinokineospora iranica TaxID=1271860 RepID=A0A1G6VNQ1_9PSEU|nr:hypothetical protein [Actinokineospora iranica]SDD55154.1 hypothetical protein SAMN05216174_11313 [Actinokineospora iranica]
MSTIPAPRPTPTPQPPTVPVGATVQLLHRWDGHVDDTTLYRDYSAALAALAASVRADWSDITHRGDVPATPDGLSDAEIVLAFYGGDGGVGDPDAPTSGGSPAAGFDIVEEVVAGPEPGEVQLRLGTFRVLDADPAETDVPAVTYCLDAAGLTVAVYTGLDGYPEVSITPDDYLSGIPITVRLEGPCRPGGFEQTCRVS